MGRPSELDPQEFLPLHLLEFRILMALTGGDRHGYAIVKEIEARESSQKIFPANLYRRLRDLLGRALIEEAPAPAKAEPERRPRRYFRLTALGMAVAHSEATRLEELVRDARERDLLSATLSQSRVE